MQGNDARRRTVFEDGAIWDLDSVTLVGDCLKYQLPCSIHFSLRLTDDNSSREFDLFADPNVTVDGQVVEFGNVGNRLESLFKVGHLLEGVTKLDDGRSLEFSRWVLE